MAQIEKTIQACSRSNIELYNFLNNSGTRLDNSLVTLVLDDKNIKQKLLSALDYYTDIQKDAKSNKKKIESGELKWRGQTEISQTLKNFIISLSEDLELDEVKTFEILDAFFTVNSKILSKITEVEEEIANLKDKNPNRSADYQNQIEKHLQEKKQEITLFYYKERISLIKSIIFIFVYDSWGSPTQGTSITKDIVKHLGDNNIFKSLVDCLVRNSTKQIDKKKDNTEKQQFLLQKIEEEELLLQTIFAILMNYTQIMKDADATKISLMNYFVDSSLQGYVYFCDWSAVAITNDFCKIREKLNDTKDMTVFTALLTLLSSSSEEGATDSLANLIKATFKIGEGTMEDLIKLTAYMVAMKSCINVGKDAKDVKELNGINLEAAFEQSNTKWILESVDGLLNNRILELDDYDFIKGPLNSVIKKWIDTASFVNIIEELNNCDEIPRICCDLIRDPFVLSEFWNKDYILKTEFYQLLKRNYLIGFPYHIEGFTTLCNLLAGTKEINFTNKVLEMLSNFDSLVIAIDRDILEKIQLARNGEFDYKTKEDFKYLITIPKGTKARVFHNGRDLFELNIRYDIWPLLIQAWGSFLDDSNDDKISEPQMIYFKKNIESISKFIWNLLIIDSTNIEYIVFDYEEVTSLEKNVWDICSLLLLSLNYLKNKSINAQREGSYDIKNSLESISMIITAIASLYSNPTYTHVVSKSLDLFENNLIGSNRSFGSMEYNRPSHNKFIYLLEELKNIEYKYSSKDYCITKSISKLASVILADPYPSKNLVEIISWFSIHTDFRQPSELEIYLNIIETYKNCLLKFKTWPTKANYDLKTLNNTPLFENLICLLNDSYIMEVLETVLELKQNENSIFSSASSSDMRLNFVNKLYDTLRDNLKIQDKKMLKKVIQSALECMNIILDLIHTKITVKKDANLNDKINSLHQQHICQLTIVSHIEEMFVPKSSYSTDLEDNKFLKTIASYIGFEYKYSMPTGSDIEPANVSSMQVTSDKFMNVSSVAIKCLTQIVRVWELSPVSKRPSLASFLTHHENNLMNCHQLISRFVGNPEETMYLFEFLICCINSQVGFINTIFKQENFFKMIIEVFCKNPERIVKMSMNDRIKKRTLGLLIILVSHLLENNKVKSNNKAKEMITEFLNAYLFNSIDTIFDLFVKRIEFVEKDFYLCDRYMDQVRHKDKLLFLMHEFKLENDVKDACFYNHVLSSYLLIISNLLISIDRDNESKVHALKLTISLFKGKINDMLRLCTVSSRHKAGDIKREFLEYLSDLSKLDKCAFNQNEPQDHRRPHTGLSEKSDFLIDFSKVQYLSLKNDNPSWCWQPKEQSQFRKSLFAYGRSYVMDRNEMFYMMQSCYYYDDFIGDFIRVLGRYNLEMSLVDSENNLLSSVHNLYAFVSSLGHDGFLGSSHDKIPSSIKKASNEVNYGFSFFTIVGGVGTKIGKNEFNKCIVKLKEHVGDFTISLWNSIKTDLEQFNEFFIDVNNVLSQSFAQKIDFFKSLFHSMIYLHNLDHSEVELFEGGSHFDKKEIKDQNDMDLEENEVVSKIENITDNIISKLGNLIFDRTNFMSDLPSDENLIENILEFVPIFFNYVIESQIMHGNSERLSKFILDIAKDLTYLLDYNDEKYYNFIVLIYEQIIKILPDRNEIYALFQLREGIIIKKMMEKITHSGCTEGQYLSTIKFMVAYSSLVNGSIHLFEERVITALISAHCLKNLDEHEYYESHERNSKHILWLWTLHLMRQLTMMLSGHSEFTYSMISFINAFESRIMKVLQFKGYIDGKKQYKSFSIAKLEEIEHIINLVSFCLTNYDQWKAQNQDQVETIVNILFSFTVDLFRGNVALTERFHPISRFEKYIENLSGDEQFESDVGKSPLLEEKKSSGFSNIPQAHKNAVINKVASSIRTPMKGEISADDFQMLDQDKYSKRDYRASTLGKYMANKYKPNGFVFKVEVILTKIALMLVRSMHCIIKYEINQGSRSNFIKELSYYHESNNEIKLYIICTNIFDCIHFTQHCQSKWFTNFENVNKLNKVLNGAYQATDILMDSSIDINDLIQISVSTSELGLLLSIMLLKAGEISKEREINASFLDFSDERLIKKIKTYAEECKVMSLEKEKIVDSSQKVNKRVFGKNNLKKPENFKDIKLKTNADIILDSLKAAK